MPIQPSTFTVESAFLARQFPGFDPAEFAQILDAILSDQTFLVASANIAPGAIPQSTLPTGTLRFTTTDNQSWALGSQSDLGAVQDAQGNWWYPQSGDHADTVAIFRGSLFSSATHVVGILGYYVAGDSGGFNVRRTNAEPAHPWKFRSKDRYTANETYDAVNGGWWEGYPIDGYTLNFRQFGYFDDFNWSTFTGTDQYPIWQALLGYIHYQVSIGHGAGYVVNLPQGAVYSTQTVVVDNCITLQGPDAPHSDYQIASCVLTFPLGVNGLDFPNAANSPTGTGASGSTIRNFKVESCNWKIPYNGWDGVEKWGIHISCGLYIENVTVRYFTGDAFQFDSTGVGGVDSIVVKSLVASTNGGNGVTIVGRDTNVCTFVSIVSVLNGRFGIFEFSLIGNTHISHQCTANGAPQWFDNWKNTANVVYEGGALYQPYADSNSRGCSNLVALQTSRPSANPSLWETLINPAVGAATSYIHWGYVFYNNKYYSVVPGQEANMWTSQPDITPAVWTDLGALPGGQAYITWKLNWSPYDVGCDYYGGATSGDNVWIRCYAENGLGESNPVNAFAAGNLILAGQMAGGSATKLSPLGYLGVNKYIQASGWDRNGNPGFPAYSSQWATAGVNAKLAGLNGEILSGIFHGDTNNPFLVRYPNTADDDVGVTNGFNGPYYMYLTGSNTTQKFGRATNQVGKVQLNGIFLGPDGNGSRQLNMSDGSWTGPHAAGDVNFYISSIFEPGKKVPDMFQRCVSAGTPGVQENLGVNFVDSYTVAQLLALNMAARPGARAHVTDSVAATHAIGDAVLGSGGGGNTLPVFYNGTAWVYG